MSPINEYTEQLVNGLEALWIEAIPEYETPYRSRLRSWLKVAPPTTVEYGIRRASRKRWKAALEGRPMSAGQTRAYCEHVILNEVAARQAAASVSGKDSQEVREQ
jgi:hypothetical protein